MYSMNTQLLEKIGLTQGEIKVYLALTKLGQVTVGPIGKESKVSKSKIYDILDKLIAKSLVGYITKEGTKYFTASEPHVLLDYIEKQEKELKITKQEVTDFIPQLLLQRSLHSSQKLAEIYEGFRSLKIIREELLYAMKRNDELMVLGAPKIANEKWEAWFLAFHRKRVLRHIPLRIIYNSNARLYGNIRQKMPLTRVRYLPNKMVSPNWIDVFSDAVLFVFVLREPLAIVIRDATLAQSFRLYFDMMWQVSRE